MKKVYFSIFSFFIFWFANAQTIYFPDPIFKARLLEAQTDNYRATDVDNFPMQIDANNNGEIEVAEALNVYGLNVETDLTIVGEQYINDLSGLENFANLRGFNCDWNNIAYLDVVPMPNLEYLLCSQNPIGFINASGLSHLKEIRAKSTNITSLNQINIQGNTVLRLLWLDGNGISNISISGLPQLEYLSLTHNNLWNVNLSNLPNLMRLDIYNNQLTAIDVTAFPNLKWFFCNDNMVTNLDVSQNTLLESLACSFNQINTLDLSNNGNLSYINAENNNLTALNIKNGKNETVLIAANPDLAYLCADESQLSDSALLVNPLTQANSYCSFSPGGVYYTVTGNSKYDGDHNGCDAQDVRIPNIKYQINDGTTTAILISNDSGDYSIPLTGGNYTLIPSVENQEYFNFSPSTLSVSFPAVSPFTQNFCITPNGSHPDLEVVIVPILWARPGNNNSYKIIFKNKGNLIQSGHVDLTFDDALMDFVSSNPAVSLQALHHLIWNFSNLLPFETRQIDFITNLNSPVAIPPVDAGTILHFSAAVIGDVADQTPADNISTLLQTAINACDPNDKICLEGETVAPEMVGENVHYRIRFENTGTANAQHIVVKDIIDLTKFDIDSLVPLDGSHSYYTKITGNKVEFIFENINLPFDDVNNDGYVLFKIKTKPTLVAGDTFSNAASIYFDYNHPVVTEPATTTISVLAVKDFAFEDYLTVYPNPANDKLHIQPKVGIEVATIEVYNVLGQLVLAIPMARQTKIIDVSNLKSGNYFIKVGTNKGISNTRFIKK